jgi:hypothetical protein
VRNGEPPSVADLSRRGPGRSEVDADVVCAVEVVMKSIEFKLDGVDDVEDEVTENIFIRVVRVVWALADADCC